MYTDFATFIEICLEKELIDPKIAAVLVQKFLAQQKLISDAEVTSLQSIADSISLQVADSQKLAQGT